MSSMSKLPLRFSPEKRKWTRVGVTSSPPNKSRRVSESKSPEPNCPICLGPIDAESFANGCFHSFCRTCLFEWSKVKAECPVCRRPFEKIIFNVESADKYEQLKVKTQRANEFQAPSTFTLWTAHSVPSSHHHHHRLISPHINLFSNGPPSLSIRINRSAPVADFARHFGLGTGFSLLRRFDSSSNSTSSAASIEVRRRLYLDNLWAKPDERRTRISSASFYRDNPALTHRLQPFVYRELTALINSEFEAQFLAQRVMDAVLHHDIRSRSFRRTIENHLVSNTDHFIHEFYSFATSPYELYEYDLNSTYVPQSETNMMTTVPPVPPLGINYEVDEPDVRPPRLSTNLSRLRNAAASSPAHSQPIACIDISDDSEEEPDLPQEASKPTPPLCSDNNADTASDPSNQGNFNINIIDDFDNPQPGPSGISKQTKIQVNIKCASDRKLMSFNDSEDEESDVEVDSSKPPHSFVPIFPSIPPNNDEEDSSDSIIFIAEEKNPPPDLDVIDVSSDDELDISTTQTEENENSQAKVEDACESQLTFDQVSDEPLQEAVDSLKETMNELQD